MTANKSLHRAHLGRHAFCLRKRRARLARAGELNRYVAQMKLIIALGLLNSCAIAGDLNEQTLSAQYTWGAEVNVVQPCGAKESYWVSANSWVLGPLVEYYRANTSKPYQPIFIRFRGHLLNEKTDGFATEYDGLMHISEVFNMAPVVPETCR